MLSYDSQRRQSPIACFAEKPLDRILLYVALTLAAPAAVFVLTAILRFDWLDCYRLPIQYFCSFASAAGVAVSGISLLLRMSADGVICLVLSGLLMLGVLPRDGSGCG